jgi:3'(2'), 5'-bisphosphate nucleotidase
VKLNADSAALRAPALVDALTALTAAAAAAIWALPSNALAAREKADCSPVTAADEAAEAVILEGLARLLPGVPVVSEESSAAWPDRDLGGSAFVLVDPLDGTRELLAGRGEYTVNVALVADGAPVVGIVAAPAQGRLWRGIVGAGAERFALPLRKAATGVPIGVRTWPAEPVALTSRSHLDAQTAALLTRIPGLTQVACGSSLKFCRLAEGEADLYPRLAPTREWDIAAAHAVLVAAGGRVTAPDGAPLVYGRAAHGFLVPAFIACGDPAAAARLLG